MTELSNTIKCGLVKYYYECNESLIFAIRKYSTVHHLKNHICTEGALRSIIKKFKDDNTIDNHPRSGRPSVSNEDINKIKVAVYELKAESDFQKCSVRQVASSSNQSYGTTYRVMTQKLNLKAYKPQHVQTLLPEDFETRLQFAQRFLAEINDDQLENILWTDEANFFLNGDVASLSGAIWSEVNPHVYIQSSMYPPKLCVWMGFSTKFIVPPFFFDGNVNANKYKEMLQSHCIKYLKDHRRFSSTIFQQDGASSHTALINRDLLKRNFKLVISKYFDLIWPARSPDLTPCDFFLWGYIKRQVFKNTIFHSLDQLQAKIITVTQDLSQEMLRNSIESVPKRLAKVIEEKGGHIKKFSYT